MTHKYLTNKSLSYKNPPLSAAILAGGKSKRLGIDKANLKIDGQNTLIEKTVKKLLLFTDDLMIICAQDLPRYLSGARTITDIFPSAVMYEREIADLFGIKVEGIPPGNRYPLPDNWPDGNYPLRKDWKPEMLESNQPVKAGELNG